LGAPLPSQKPIRSVKKAEGIGTIRRGREKRNDSWIQDVSRPKEKKDQKKGKAKGKGTEGGKKSMAEEADVYRVGGGRTDRSNWGGGNTDSGEGLTLDETRGRRELS